MAIQKNKNDKKPIHTPLKARILVVDDDANFAETLSDDIKANFKDVEVLLATNSTMAQKLLKTGQFDMVLLDYYLEGNTTAEKLIPIFKQSGAHIIVISAEAGGEEAASTVRLGADDYWSKDRGFNSLVPKIKLFLSSKQQGIIMESQKREYSAFFKLFLTENPGLVSKITPILKSLKRNNTFSLIVSGETGVGKSFFVHSVKDYLKSLYGNVRFITLTNTITPEEVKNFILQGRKAFRDGLTVLFFVNKITNIHREMHNYILEILDIIREERNSSGRLYLFAESDEEDIVRTRGKLPKSLFFRFERTLTIPPLQERWEDILLLAEHFLNRNRDSFQPKVKFSPDARYMLLNLQLEGNVLQLQNIVRSIEIDENEEEITSEKLKKIISADSYHLLSLDELEKQQIIKALMATNCKKNLAAKLLHISYPTLNKKMTQYNIKC